MKQYSFFVDGKLILSGSKEMLSEKMNKTHCLCVSDFNIVDEKGSFSYYSNGRCVLKPFESKK